MHTAFISKIYLISYFSFFAGIIGLIYFSRLHFTGRVIVSLLWINLTADIIALFRAINYLNTATIYNILTPLEQIITILLYYYTSSKVFIKKVHIIIIILLSVLIIIDALFIAEPGSFHFFSFIVGGILLSILSYLKLRELVFEPAPFVQLFTWFVLGNLVYYTLMISSMSSQPLAREISISLAASLKIINNVAYILWSLLIAFGIIWSSKRIT